MNNTLKKISGILLALMVALTFTSCEKEDMEAYGEFEVYMTDSPGAYESLEVEIEKIEAYHESDGWITLNEDVQVLDILTLTNGREEKVAKNERTRSGNYSKVRITFGANNNLSVDVLGISTDFALGVDSQVEIEIETMIEEGQSSRLLLDFHVGESVQGSANSSFTLTPVITVITDENTGVQGSVQDSQRVYLQFSGNGENFDGYSDNQGNFMIHGMAAGTYSLTIQPEDTENYPSEVYIENVTVMDGVITNTGTIMLN